MNNTLEEAYYRAIKRSQPNCIDEKKNKPTSAFFKDENGVSMDRKAERTEEMVIAALKNKLSKRFKGMVVLKENDILLQANAYIHPAPSIDDPYHVELYKNHTKEELSNIQALILADLSKILFINDNPPWNK